MKKHSSNKVRSKIANVDCEIRNYFHAQKRLAVRRVITSGCSAVNIAKDMNANSFP